MQNTFNSEEMALLSKVVEKACADVGGCDEPTKNMFAAHVLALASRGERDFEILVSAIKCGHAKETANG